jgi:phage baseplate assembly protein V
MSPRAISKLLQPLQRKLSQVVSRAVVRVINDGLKMQELQLTVMADETLDGVERFQNYGFTSHPKAGAEAITLSVGGHRSHSVAVVVDDRRYRLKALQAGEVALYDDLGQKVVLHRDHILVKSPKVLVDSDDVHLGGENGERVARVGDRVQVGSGSSAGLWPIVEGSSKVSSE